MSIAGSIRPGGCPQAEACAAAEKTWLAKPQCGVASSENPSLSTPVENSVDALKLPANPLETGGMGWLCEPVVGPATALLDSRTLSEA